MKTKKLFLALTLPMAFAACSNEELLENNATPAEGNLVELGEGFALAVQGASDNGVSTRGIWEVDGKALGWSWVPQPVAANGNSTLGTGTTLGVIADEIGLCWTGELPDGSGSIGNKVLTNYQFIHNGWLAEGQEAAIIGDCAPFALINGKEYKDVVVGGLTATSSVDQTKNQLEDVANQVTIDNVAKDLQLNSGIFNTENKAIFGGSYIAYYPYNEGLTDAGSLPAISPVAYNDVTVGNVSDAHVAKNTFLVGYAQNLIGGKQASELSLKPLSAIISLQLKGTTKVVTKVALWSQDGFVKSVGLNASKIKESGAAAGEALYEGTKETASTIIANLKAPLTLSTTAQNIYLPVLPTTAKALKAIVYANDGTVAVISLGDQTFKAGQGAIVAVNMVVADFKKDQIAVDNASLVAAAALTPPVSIKVIGDITLTANLTVPDEVTITDGKIIVPENITLTLKEGAVINSTIDVLGQTCCGNSTAAGKMVVEAKAVVTGNVNALAGYTKKLAGSLEFNGTASNASVVAATATIVSSGAIDFKGATDIRGTLTLNAGAKAVLSAGISDVNVKGGTVNNNGIFEVANGNFAMLDAGGNTVAAAGKNFKNNGTFIDNVGTVVGGATQYMVFGTNGDYICYVNEQKRLDEAFVNKTACSTIQFVNTSAKEYKLEGAITHNGKFINLIDAGTATTIVNTSTAVTPAAIGNLTVNESSTLAVKAGTKGVIQVNGNIVLNGTFTTAEDLQGMTATNLTINEGGAATFANRVDKLGVALAIASTIEVKKGGSFTITAAAAGKNIADVTCKTLIEGGTFNGKPRVIE